MCFAFFTQGKENEKKTTKAILEKSLVMEKKKSSRTDELGYSWIQKRL